MPGSPDSTTSGSGVPPIRTFQFDSSSIGQLASAVNLFRGDVNIPQKLFSMPARRKDSGLGVDFSILYQSNVFQQTAIWNRDAPTGILGLGWNFPLTSIQATSTGSPDPETRAYLYSDNGGSSPLIRQPQQPFLFSMPARIAKTLNPGQVPAAMLALFLQTGLPMDPGTQVSGSDGAWTLSDGVLQQIFLIQPSATDDTLANVYYGGQAFQLLNYSFWHIVYFPLYERWLIVTDDGTRKSFGGLAASVTAPTGQKFNTSTGNSIAWQVWWALNGVPAWTGPSLVTDGQVQVATAWYLASSSDPFGDAVTYQYNGWERTAAGIIPEAEQQVGNGGLPYTKAVYLTQVTDVFGRTAVLNYGEKVWDSSDDTSPREYSDPHQAQPSNLPNAYQDQYQTKFLSSVALAATDGTPILNVVFSYCPSPSAQGLEQAVANVNPNFTGSLLGDTYKRYLTGVSIQNAAGAALPGYAYDYFLDPTEQGAQPGALKTITCPQGGQANYAYQSSQVSCSREQIVPSPGANYAPRVFYGDNYVVLLWVDANTSVITLQVWSWIGQWVSWQMSSGSTLLDTVGQYQGFDLSSVNVMANAQFFVVTVDSGANSLAFVFNKNIACPGQFTPAVLGDVNTGYNQATVTLPVISSSQAVYSCGSSFFVASSMDTYYGTGTYYVYIYSWVSREWTQWTPPDLPFNYLSYVVASGEYLFVADQYGNVSLGYLDGALNWHWPSSPQLSTALGNALNPPPGNNMAGVALTPGPDCVVMNVLGTDAYQVIIVQWDANHNPVCLLNQNFDAPAPAGTNAPLVAPIVVANSLVAVSGSLLRFNGAAWVSNTALVVENFDPGQTQYYAYGVDYAVQVLSISGTAQALAVGYDPDAGAWNAEPASVSLPSQLYPYDNFPFAAADFAALGPSVYFRGTATDWTTVFSSAQPIADLGALSSGFVSESLVNEAPNFMSYAVIQPDGTETVQSVILQNGAVLNGAAIPFSGEKMFTAALEGQLGAGVSPQGPSLFVTYTGNSFESATAVNLHQYAGAAVAGQVQHYPIYQLAIDDQYQDVSVTTYYQDSNNAACDPSGMVVKYYQTTVYPGSSDTTGQSYGYTVNTYLNPQNPQGIAIGSNYYDMLDGLLVETAIYDAGKNLLESQSSTWSAINQVASDPVDGSATPLQLRGGWLARTQQTSFKDGVTKTKQMAYVPEGLPAPYTGQPAAITLSSPNNQGTWLQTISYGVEVSPAMQALNLRSAQAQSIMTQLPPDDQPVTVTSAVSTFAMWASAAGTNVQVPAQEASFKLLNAAADFPYSSYTPGSTPPGWLLASRVVQRTLRGQVVAHVDGCGTATSIIFSTDLTFPVAMVSNAAPGQAAYLGFEPYEDTTSWKLPNTQTETSDVRTGATSLVLPGGASAQVSTSVGVNPAAQNYVVGFWYKTAAGFTPANGAGCTVAYAGTTYAAAFANTNGEWALATIGVPVASGGATLQLTIANSAAQDVLLDAVYAAPLPGSMIARAYDPVTQNYTSTMDSGGRTRWAYYDSFQRPSIQVGPDGQPKELAQRFFSRQGTPSDTFQDASPNAELTLHPADGGTMETFLDGDAWQQNWLPGNAADWSASAGALTNSSGATATLTCQTPLPPTWALYFEAPSGNAIALTAGEVTVSWLGSAYSATADGTALTALAAPPAMASHWLLVAGDGILLFFADGQLMYSQTGNFAWDAPVIAAGAGVSLTHLALLAAPRLSLSYNDGASRQRQLHQLYGADSRVSEIIYDPLDRIIATTRVAPGSFGSGASQPTLQYRPGFVDVGAFIASFSTTGVMKGDVADYYAGQMVNGITRSNDLRYPYYGTLWEPSPRQKRIELGLPGEPYAIANQSTTTPAQRTTLQMAYGASSGSGLNLPDGLYSQEILTSPVKTAAFRLTDMRGQSVGAMQQDSFQSVTASSAGLRAYTETASGPQAALNLQLPNCLLAGPQEGNTAFVRTTVSDAAGRIVSGSDPDSGQTRFIFDLAGHVRFVQPAMAQGEQWFLYNKYDAVGRVIERGTIPQEWDASMLAAADPSWPGPDVARTVAYAWTYDGDGNTPVLIGQKISCVTTTSTTTGTPCVTTERFAYDISGRVISVSLSVSGPATAQGVTGYTNNNLGEIVAMTLPAGSPVTQVGYTINDQGWITAVGAFASYTYTIEGDIETESLGGGAWTRAVQYLSPRWAQQSVTTSADGTQSFTLAYDYNPDSTFSGRQVTYQFANISGALSDTYSYDGQGRLIGAAGGSNEFIQSYDPNGNIFLVSQAGDAQSFAHAPESDQLATVTLTGTTTPVSYDIRGRMTDSLGRMFSYDDSTNLTSYATAGAVNVQLGYGGRGQRVLKLVGGALASQSIYFTGSSAVPVARVDNGVWSAMIYGPAGLTAIVSDQTYYPLKDAQGTVWAVVDAGGLVARYVYLPFGAMTADGPNPNVTAYRYMGQEWDADLALYNFRNRMYDPLLRCFLAPDATLQFPSPYVFCANNPLTATDPTGNLSLWGRIGVGVLVGGALVAGTVLTVMTFGAAAPAAAAADTAAIGAGAAAEGAAAAGSAAAGEAAAGAAADAAAGAGEVAAGVGESSAVAAPSAAAPAGAAEGGASTAASWAQAANSGTQVLGAIYQGAGASGLQYDAQHGRDFRVGGFFESVAFGALTGLIGGVAGQAGSLVASGEFMAALVEGLEPGQKFAASVMWNTVSGFASSAFTNTMQNLADKDPLYEGLLATLYLSFAGGLLLSSISAFSSMQGGIACLTFKIGDANIVAPSSMVDLAQENATGIINQGMRCSAAPNYIVDSYSGGNPGMLEHDPD